MFGRAYGDAHMPNWPHWHRTTLPGIATTGLRRDKGGKILWKAETYSVLPKLEIVDSEWE